MSDRKRPANGRQSKKIQADMIEFINKATQETVDTSNMKSVPPSEDDLAPLVRTIVKASDMRKASDIVAMRISKVSSLSSFVVIVSGNSRPQNQAIAAAIKDEVKEAFGDEYTLLGNGVPEGNADSGWILMDYGDVMVHVMTPKSRLFYDIEGKWKKGGEYMNLDDVLLPNSPMSQSSSVSTSSNVVGGMTGLTEEEDPFWS
jgi:ribosome-associated protein